MIKKIFIEENNDERTNILKLVLDTEKIPYFCIKDAKEEDFTPGNRCEPDDKKQSD